MRQQYQQSQIDKEASSFIWKSYFCWHLNCVKSVCPIFQGSSQTFVFLSMTKKHKRPQFWTAIFELVLTQAFPSHIVGVEALTYDMGRFISAF